MCARAGQRPVENPEEDGQAQPDPAMQREFGSFAFDVFDLGIGRHAPSVH